MGSTCDECSEPIAIYALERRSQSYVRERKLCDTHGRAFFCGWPLQYDACDTVGELCEPICVGHTLAAVAVPVSGGDCCVYLSRVGGAGSTIFKIGHFEARAIGTTWLGTPQPRPLTHATAASIIKALGASLARVVIDELIDDVYHATLQLISGRGTTEAAVDVRPSDAIALALECDAPIFIDRRVLVKQRQRFPDFY